MTLDSVICELVEFGISYDDLADTETRNAIQDEFELSDSQMTEIWDLVQSGKISLTTLYIPEGTIAIESGRYANNQNFDTVVFPSTLRRVGDNAFANCWNLKFAEFNDGLDYIGESAFFHTGIIAVTLPMSVRFVGVSAFSNCDDLSSFVCSGQNIVLSDYALAYCKQLDEIDIKSKYVSRKCFIGSDTKKPTNSTDIREFESEIYAWLYENTEINDDYRCLRGNILPTGEMLHNPNNCVHNIIESDICDFLNAKCGTEFYPNQGMYGELILDRLGCVRLNGQYEYFVVLPNQVTKAQLDTLETWLDYIFEYTSYKKPIQICTIDGKQVALNPYDYTGYDVIQYIKRNL